MAALFVHDSQAVASMVIPLFVFQNFDLEIGGQENS